MKIWDRLPYLPQESTEQAKIMGENFWPSLESEKQQNDQLLIEITLIIRENVQYFSDSCTNQANYEASWSVESSYIF